MRLLLSPSTVPRTFSGTPLDDLGACVDVIGGCFTRYDTSLVGSALALILECRLCHVLNATSLRVVLLISSSARPC